MKAAQLLEEQSSLRTNKDKLSINLTFDGVFFTLMFDGGGGVILSTLFLPVKTIKKVIFFEGVSPRPYP